MVAKPSDRGLFGKFNKKHPLAQELEIIRRTDSEGGLKTRNVVDWARQRPRSALHAEFEWDDSKAGEMYRREQARRIIQVHVDICLPTTIESRVYVSLPPNRGRVGYVQMEAVMADEAQRRVLLSEAYREMRIFVARYRHLQELVRVIEVMEEGLSQSGIAANAGGGKQGKQGKRKPRSK